MKRYAVTEAEVVCGIILRGRPLRPIDHDTEVRFPSPVHSLTPEPDVRGLPRRRSQCPRARRQIPLQARVQGQARPAADLRPGIVPGHLCRQDRRDGGEQVGR